MNLYSTCIFENLSLEWWLYEHEDFSQKDILLVWSNEPAVVIGRHQNPWAEANLRYLKANDIKLARRKSGGGTVYHDLQNINFSFLTKNSRHNREKNLQTVAAVLQKQWNLPVEVLKRHDVLLDQRKVPGSI